MATKLEMYSATHKSVTVARGQRKENTDRAMNQSDCMIRYRALWEKKNKSKYQPWSGTFFCIPATLIRLDVVTNYII